MTGVVERGAITDGCKAIHGKPSNEFIAAHWPRSPGESAEQKRARVKIAEIEVIARATRDLVPLGGCAARLPRPIWNDSSIPRMSYPWKRGLLNIAYAILRRNPTLKERERENFIILYSYKTL